MAEIPLVESQQHRAAIISSNRVVVVDNFTTWCEPCKQVAPHFAKLAQQYQGKCVCVKENVEKSFEGAPTIRGVPCFHFYVNGEHIQELTVTGGSIEKVAENLAKIFA